MAGGQSEVEMQPLQHGEGQEKRHYWDNVFRTLAEADGDEVDHVRTGGVPTIHIRNLKDFLPKRFSFCHRQNKCYNQCSLLSRLVCIVVLIC